MRWRSFRTGQEVPPLLRTTSILAQVAAQWVVESYSDKDTDDGPGESSVSSDSDEGPDPNIAPDLDELISNTQDEEMTARNRYQMSTRLPRIRSQEARASVTATDDGMATPQNGLIFDRKYTVCEHLAQIGLNAQQVDSLDSPSSRVTKDEYASDNASSEGIPLNAIGNPDFEVGIWLGRYRSYQELSEEDEIAAEHMDKAPRELLQHPIYGPGAQARQLLKEVREVREEYDTRIVNCRHGSPFMLDAAQRKLAPELGLHAAAHHLNLEACECTTQAVTLRVAMGARAEIDPISSRLLWAMDKLKYQGNTARERAPRPMNDLGVLVPGHESLGRIPTDEAEYWAGETSFTDEELQNLAQPPDGQVVGLSQLKAGINSSLLTEEEEYDSRPDTGYSISMVLAPSLLLAPLLFASHPLRFLHSCCCDLCPAADSLQPCLKNNVFFSREKMQETCLHSSCGVLKDLVHWEYSGRAIALGQWITFTGGNTYTNKKTTPLLSCLVLRNLNYRMLESRWENQTMTKFFELRLFVVQGPWKYCTPGPKNNATGTRYKTPGNQGPGLTAQTTRLKGTFKIYSELITLVDCFGNVYWKATELPEFHYLHPRFRPIHEEAMDTTILEQERETSGQRLVVNMTNRNDIPGRDRCGILDSDPRLFLGEVFHERVASLDPDQDVTGALLGFRVQFSAARVEHSSMIRKPVGLLDQPNRQRENTACISALLNINGIEAYVLVDSGSTTNSMTPEFAKAT
ncbi:hypothetical protein B0H17DRAFT_1140924 [Mycena rosella]|uniref:Uncharacterized protein n=1 Tax=Mycena rosella TaxID=1033263 RepID=A0AAD7D4N9_MYCRO|nr:hypothetical protein B0H17DRAFT_1140924 [Mycena rosella]